jgi:hypothetical protein
MHILIFPDVIKTGQLSLHVTIAAGGELYRRFPNLNETRQSYARRSNAVLTPSDISLVSNHQGTGDSKWAGHNRKEDGFHDHQN